ncbi:MAG: right-handed parallel beta-helix repeat-containing protein, partial [Nitrospirae bacterium]|nr:right-handed parallel beta-helix repeat-containing protein [Nitrospirota bacterium]
MKSYLTFKKTLLLFAILLFPSGIFAATSVGGRISTDTTWTLSGSPYVVTSSVQFYGTTSTPITLTIQPGVVVKFQTGTYLQIANGTSYPASLNAAGMAEAPIVFTSYKDDTAGGDTNGDGSATTPAPGNWNYIYLYQGSGSSVLDHTEVRYGGSGGQGDVYVYGASPTIQNSVITQSSNIGILLSNTSSTITNITVDQVGSDGISLNGASGYTTAPSISQATISNAGRYGIYVSTTYGIVGGTIQNSTISSPGQYGIYCAISYAINTTIQNNQIAKAIWFTGNAGSPALTGNVIQDLGSVTAQIPADILNAFLTQNTLQGIGPTTSLNVLGDTMTGTTTLTTQWYSYVVSGN